MEKITLKVPGISCGHCVHTIKTELLELEGVKEVEAVIDTKLVTVVYDSITTEAAVRELLREINYPAE